MKKLRYKLEDYLRGLRLYLDYYLFRLKNIKLKKVPEKINKILVIEQKYIGDIIVTTPTIRALKENFPKAKIDVLVLEGMEDVLVLNPNINRVFNKLEDVKEGYDLGVILHYGSKEISKWLKEKAKFRIGCTRPLFREGKGYYLDRKTKPVMRLKNKVEDNLDVVKMIGVDVKDKKLEIYVRKEGRKVIKDLGVREGDFLVVIHPGVRHARSHEWFLERFGELADILVSKYNVKVVFSGGKKDIELVDKILRLMENKAKNMAGKTNIQEFFALVERADLVISVDTSAMHVGAGLKRPVIALFGAGNPEIWRPYSENSVVLYKDDRCVSCMKEKCKLRGEREMECMRAIKVEDILKEFEKVYSCKNVR